MQRFRLIALIGLILVGLLPAARAAEPAQGEVWLLGDDAATGLPLATLAVYLQADLRTHALTLVRTPGPRDATPARVWLKTAALPESLVAVVWLACENAGGSSDNPPETLVIHVYFPQNATHLTREMSLCDGQPPATAPLAAIISAMLVNQRPASEPALASEPEPVAPAISETPNSQPALTGLKPSAEPAGRQRLMLDAEATAQLHPQSETYLYGATLGLAYSPREPLALLVAVSVLDAPTLSHARYNLNYLAVPILAGGRGSFRIGPHDLRVDLGMLGAISRVSFSDRLSVVPESSQTRVNVGFLTALGYTYYPLDLFGVGLRLAAGFTPRVQDYAVNGETLLAPGAWFLQIAVGLRFDPLN